ncbi:hypothetical protein L3X38_004653 [Prunus dulcis]|uniref:Uncharacterized protein n=1 Tax=Prunus dulcis TaxID=3755 RepID=A0AAD4ZPF0_PRUDU|nr:hypothetical protein L3X38_004653 [Prunus dulcis]
MSNFSEPGERVDSVGPDRLPTASALITEDKPLGTLEEIPWWNMFSRDAACTAECTAMIVPLSVQRDVTGPCGTGPKKPVTQLGGLLCCK